MKTIRRKRRSSQRKERAKRGIRVERLEDRRLLAAASFTGLGDLPGGDYDSFATGVSDDGQTVVGVSNGLNGFDQPFRWTAGDGISALAPLPGGADAGRARAASADGSVIVGISDGKSVRWENGIAAELGQLAAGLGYAGAYDVSDDGNTVVGSVSFDSCCNSEAFRWDDGTLTPLDHLPVGGSDSVAIALSGDGSFVVGWDTNSNGNHEPVRWSSDGAITTLGFHGRARDVSADGSTIAGHAYIEEEGGGRGKKPQITIRNEAFRWTESGGRELLGDLPGGENNSVAYAISSDGSLVAGYSYSANGLEAFLWNEADGMRSMNDILSNDYGVDLSGWHLARIWDMTPDGQTLVGDGINPSGNTEAFVIHFGPPSPGITVTPTSGLVTTEGGGSATFNVSLNTQPTADVTIGISSSDSSEGMVDVSTLTFTAANWDVPQTVTVTGADDAVEDGDVGYMIVIGAAVSADVDYGGMYTGDVSVTNIDDDVTLVPLYVYDIGFESKRGGKDWRAVFEIRIDSNGNGVGDSADDAIAGVQIDVVFAGQSFSGVTDSSGVFRTDWFRDLSSGSYYANVVDLALTGYVWDSQLDLEDDDDTIAGPDDLLMF